MNRSEFQLRQEIVQIGRLLYERGLISANEGNISARLGPNQFLITPSGLHKGLLNKDELLIVDENGQRVGAGHFSTRHLKPTSELPMHLEAYRQRPDIKAVVHAHPPITIALTIAGIALADCLLPEVIVFLGIIPTSQYATPSSDENIDAVSELITGHDAVVLQRHGALTVGDSPMQAFMRMETVEQNARIAYMLAQLGASNPLPPNEVRKLLAQRAAMGLCHPGEESEFCDICGVCHTGLNHAATMYSGGKKRKLDSENSSKRVASGPHALPPIQPLGSDDKNLRELVTQVVQKTLGGSN